MSSWFQTVLVGDNREAAKEFMMPHRDDQASRAKLNFKARPLLAYFARQASPSEGPMASSNSITN